MSFGFDSNDLSDFFSAVSVGKRKRQIEKDSLVGESFDNLFWNQITESKKNLKKKEIVQETLNEEIKYTEPNYTEPVTSSNKDPLTPLNQEFITVKEFNQHYKLF